MHRKHTRRKVLGLVLPGGVAYIANSLPVSAHEDTASKEKSPESAEPEEALPNLVIDKRIIPDDQREMTVIGIDRAGADHTEFVRFDVGARERDFAHEASVLLTTNTGRNIRIEFDDPIRRGESSRVSLDGRGLRVVKIQFRWYHNLAITHLAERKASRGKYFAFAYIYLNDFVDSDRDISLVVDEKAL